MGASVLNRDTQVWRNADPPGKSLLTSEEWDQVGLILELTPREKQVCQLLFLGITRVKIADQLQIKPRTVRHFTEQIHTKLQVNNRVGVVLRIIEIRDSIRRTAN